MGVEAELRAAAQARRMRLYGRERTVCLPLLRREHGATSIVGEHRLFDELDDEPTGVPMFRAEARFAHPIQQAIPRAQIVMAEELEARISARRLIERTARDTRVSVEEITGGGRHRLIVRARHLAIWRIAVTRPDMSLPQIGRLFGDRDHTTILHAIREHDAKLRELGKEAYFDACLACRYFTMEQLVDMWERGYARTRKRRLTPRTVAVT